jgi:hypothetical protein
VCGQVNEGITAAQPVDQSAMIARVDHQIIRSPQLLFRQSAVHRDHPMALFEQIGNQFAPEIAVAAVNCDLHHIADRVFMVERVRGKARG